MFRPLELFIGLRYTRAKRRNHFISFISMISMLGLAVGVMALIVVISVMNGFEKELTSRILGMVAHATISGVRSERRRTPGPGRPHHVVPGRRAPVVGDADEPAGRMPAARGLGVCLVFAERRRFEAAGTAHTDETATS